MGIEDDITEEIPPMEITRQEIANCLMTGRYSQTGRDKKGDSCQYCTYFTVSNQRQTWECGGRGDIIEIAKGGERDPLFTYHVTFYKCSRRGKKWD
jgi:hypothetical protein